ncbi:MAG: hypothetical protein ACR2NO_12150 [Chloroflexota bacterium]
MRRRPVIAFLTGVGLVGCRQNAEAPSAAAPAQKQDPKVLAASLQAKTVAFIDAIAARNDQRTATAKADLEKETNRVEDAIKSETGGAANRVNSAINRIRQAIITNDVAGLTAAKDLLQQAQQS